MGCKNKLNGTIIMLYSPKNLVILHPHLPITATLLCFQGCRCREVQLYLSVTFSCTYEDLVDGIDVIDGTLMLCT